MAEQFTTVERWVPLQGRWEVERSHVTFVGTPETLTPAVPPQVSPPGAPAPLGIALTNAWFDSGRLKTEITLPAMLVADGVASGSAYGRLLLGFRSLSSAFVSVGVGSSDGEAYLIEGFNPDSRPQWQRLTGSGSMANLTPDRPEPIEVALKGQRITMSVDGAIVLDHVLGRPLERGQVAVLAQGAGPVKFGPVEVSTRLRSAFVVMQFTSPYDELFGEVIRPVCAEAGIKAYRASDVHRPGIIMQDIIQGLAESDVIISEITPANPNVFYELGYAHALDKPVIMLAERGRELPFDVSGYRVIFYEDAIAGKSNLETGLRDHLANIFGDWTRNRGGDLS